MLEGPRLALKPLERKHLTQCVTWLNDPEVIEFLTISEPMSMEKEQKWYENYLKDKSSKVYVIETKKGKHIGNLGLHDIDLHNRKAEMGIFIGEKNLWGDGYGTEAVKLGLKLAFEGLNLNRVYLKVFIDNKRAQKCYERAGFKKEGMLRQEEFKDGKYIDCIIYSVLAREYFG